MAVTQILQRFLAGSLTGPLHWLRSSLPILRITLLGLLVSTVLVSCSKEQQSVEFDVATEEGRFFSADYQDKVVYLDFWATWCAPCRASFPWMNEMREKYKSEGLQIVAVSIDADRVLARRFATELGARFEVGYDPEGNVADLFDVNVMPTSVILGKGGTVIEVHKGFNEAKKVDYENAIVSALKAL